MSKGLVLDHVVLSLAGRVLIGPLDLSIALGGTPANEPPLAPLGQSPPSEQLAARFNGTILVYRVMSPAT